MIHQHIWNTTSLIKSAKGGFIVLILEVTKLSNTLPFPTTSLKNWLLPMRSVTALITSSLWA